DVRRDERRAVAVPDLADARDLFRRQRLVAAAAHRAAARDEVNGVAGGNVDAKVVDDGGIDLRREVRGVLQPLEALGRGGDGQLLERDRDLRRGQQNERCEGDEYGADESDGDLPSERKFAAGVAQRRRALSVLDEDVLAAGV